MEAGEGRGFQKVTTANAQNLQQKPHHGPITLCQRLDHEPVGRKRRKSKPRKGCVELALVGQTPPYHIIPSNPSLNRPNPAPETAYIRDFD